MVLQCPWQIFVWILWRVFATECKRCPPDRDEGGSSRTQNAGDSGASKVSGLFNCLAERQPCQSSTSLRDLWREKCLAVWMCTRSVYILGLRWLGETFFLVFLLRNQANTMILWSPWKTSCIFHGFPRNSTKPWKPWKHRVGSKNEDFQEITNLQTAKIHQNKWLACTKTSQPRNQLGSRAQTNNKASQPTN